MTFVSLHVKSHHSLGLGTASIPELTQRTLQYAGRGAALGLADLENLRGQVEFHAACRARELRPLSGVELRRGFEPGRSPGERAGRIVVLASDQRSYAQLCQLVTRRRAAPGRSAEPLSIVPAVCEGLYLLSDDPAVLESLVRLLGSRWVRGLLVRPDPTFGERELIEASRRLGVRLVADLDAALLDACDAELQALLGAIQRGSSVQRSAGAAEARVLLDSGSAERLFADLPEALLEARAVADACRVNVLEAAQRPLGPGLGPGLQAACRDALRGAGRSQDRRYVARLSEELAAIQSLGLAELFAAVAALVFEARRCSIPVAARGSAVSSLVGHLLGFSPVDPIEQGLFFERFASEARQRPPDIDLDVASRGREQLATWLLQRQGAQGAARVGALHGFGPRSALREGLKAFGVAQPEIEECVRSLPAPELGGDFSAVTRHLRWPGRTRKLQPLLARLIGKPRRSALHPGGVVLGRAEQLARIPLERSASGPLVSQYDSRSISALGLCKVDLLGNRCWMKSRMPRAHGPRVSPATSGHMRVERAFRWVIPPPRAAWARRRRSAAISWSPLRYARCSPACRSAACTISPTRWPSCDLGRPRATPRRRSWRERGGRFLRRSFPASSPPCCNRRTACCSMRKTSRRSFRPWRGCRWPRRMPCAFAWRSAARIVPGWRGWDSASRAGPRNAASRRSRFGPSGLTCCAWDATRSVERIPPARRCSRTVQHS